MFSSSTNSPSTALFKDLAAADRNHHPQYEHGAPNPFVRTAWVRRLGVDAFSALPIHVKAEYNSVADLLLSAHKLLYTKKDCVAASDVELTTESGIPLSNLDSLEVLAAFCRKELMDQQQQQQMMQTTPNKQQSDNLLQQQQDRSSAIKPRNTINSNNNDPVDVFLIVRRRQFQRGAAYATSSLVEAVLMQDPKLQQRQQEQQKKRTQTPTSTTKRATTPAASTPNSTRSARLRKENTEQQTIASNNNSSVKKSRTATPTTSTTKPKQQQQQQLDPHTPQGRAVQDARDAARAQLFPPSTLNNPTVTSATRQQSTVVHVLTSPNSRRRASPTRQEIEDAVLQCKEFSAKWLQQQVCDYCNRPKRLHTLESIKLYEEKVKRHQSPAISSRKDFSIIFSDKHRSTPLWKPRKVTPKVTTDANPLTCTEFLPQWARDQFCQICNGPRKEHSRIVQEHFEEKHRIPPHDPNRFHNSSTVLLNYDLAQRPLLHSIVHGNIDISDEGFEERREHRRLAQAARCEAFVPLWNHNKFCAICFQLESVHSVEKRYFNFPTLSLKDKLAVLGARPDYLTTQYHSSSTAKNWWLVNVPWRHIVVFLPLEDLFSLSASERWLCVEIRPLLHSALTMIVQTGVSAHYDLRQDTVRISSHLERCSGEVRSMLARVMDGVFHNNNNNNNSDQQQNDTDAEHDNESVTTTTCEPIIVSGTVGARSALLRKFSRLGSLEAKKMQNRKQMLETLSKLEHLILEQQTTASSSSTTTKNGNNFENVHAVNACAELVRILRRTETQHEICRRSRRYLDQDFLPL